MIWFLIPVLLLVIYFYWTWDDGFWKKRNVPHDKPHVLFGDIKNLMLATKHFAVVFKEIYDKFPDAPYCGMFNMKTPALMIRDPELIKNILVKDFQHFEKNDVQVDEKVDPLMGANIFMQHGEEWKKNRSAWTVAMTSSKLKLMYDTAKSKSDVMIDHLKQQLKDNPSKSFETRDLSVNYFTDVIVTSVFKLKSNCFAESYNPFKEATKKFFTPDFWDGWKQGIFFMIPKLASVLGIGFVPKSVQDIIMKITRDIHEIRKDAGFDKNNPLDLILQNKSGNELTVSTAATIFNFITDGTETSGGVSAFALYFLAANPEMRRKLREEVMANISDDGKPSYEQLSSLPYLEMIINETMRIYPPAGALIKSCTKNYTFPGINKGDQPLEIKKGSSIIIPTYGLHMDPKYFPEPERFIPERFNQENKKKLEKCAFIPFGEGPRVCIGSRMALNQIKLLICVIIKEFEIRLGPEMYNKTIEIDPKLFIMRAIGDLHITMHEINE